jgi:hypothetical protein
MKKILFIQPKLEGVGGIEKVIPVVAEFIAKKGYEVESLTLYGVVPNDQRFWLNKFCLDEKTSKSFFHKISKSIQRLIKLRKFISLQNLSKRITTTSSLIHQ